MAHRVVEEWETGGNGMQNWECGLRPIRAYAPEGRRNKKGMRG